MKKNQRFFYTAIGALSVFVLPVMAFAQELEEGSHEEPMWFSVLEVLGLVVAGFGMYHIYKIIKAHNQGILGKAFKYYGVAVLSISLSLVYKGIIELMAIENGFVHELVYEGFVGAGIILIAIGSEIAHKALVNIADVAKSK